MPQLGEKLKNMPGIEKVTLTTNGVLLKDQMSDFARAGLDGLNISLDTLDEACSRRITRRDELGRTLEGISEAMKYPEISLKINCVPLGIQEQDLCRVALFARDHRVHVRFIEMMPIGMGKEFHGVSEEELLRILGEKLPRFSPYVGKPLGNGPCHYYDVDGFSGKIGFISAVSHKFCGECNRIRLTSQGFLKTCLQYAAGRDLREVIRSGGLDEVLKDVESDSAAKQQAVDQASAIAENILEESNVESLLEAKGYMDCVAYITSEECSVVVSGALEDSDTLIVQEVVMEQTGLTADKIKIIGTN